MDKHTLEGFFIAKKKNARIQVVLYKCTENGTHSIVINTKRLHSFKDRKIAESSNIYSIDTLYAIHELLTYLFDESTYFKKEMHWQLPKEPFKVKTNVR